MKRHLSFNIYWAFLGIPVVLVGIWAVVYLSHFEHSISGNNADWGNFGDFFWGLGVMCFTALNVYVFWQIEQQMRRDSFVRDLRNLTEKIREAQNTNEDKVIFVRIESFKFAVSSTLESGLLSKRAKECVQRLLTHLQAEQIDFKTAHYFCEAIIYAISVNKSIDDNPNEVKLGTFAELGLLEKLNLWEDEKLKDKTEQDVNEPKKEEEFSFEDYLHKEFQTAKWLSRLFPKAKIYPQVKIPNSNLVIDALMVKEGENDTIIEFKNNCTQESVQKAIRQLETYKEAYKKAYSKDVNLAILFEGSLERSGMTLSPHLMMDLRMRNISILSLPENI